jgi:hypothetical protein
MQWRVVVLADLIDPVESSKRLRADPRDSEPEVEPAADGNYRLTVTAEGTDGLDAGGRALSLIRDILGGQMIGVPHVSALHPHGEDFNPYAIGSAERP